jgi:hypothetical protein
MRYLLFLLLAGTVAAVGLARPVAAVEVKPGQQGAPLTTPKTPGIAPWTGLGGTKGPCTLGFSGKAHPRSGHKYICYSGQIGTLRETWASIFGCNAPYQVANDSPAVDGDIFVYRCGNAGSASPPVGINSPCTYPGWYVQDVTTSAGNRKYLCKKKYEAHACEGDYKLEPGSPLFRTDTRRFYYVCTLPY